MWKKKGKEEEGEEMRGRERRIKNEEGDTRSVPPLRKHSLARS